MNNQRNLNGELLTVKKDARVTPFSPNCRAVEMSEVLVPATAMRQLVQSCNILELAVVQRQPELVAMQGWENEELIGNLTCELEQNFELTSADKWKALQVSSHYTKKEDIRTRYHFRQPLRMRL